MWTGDFLAEHGHLWMLEEFASPGNCAIHGFSTRAMDKAAANGHLDVVKWLHCNRLEGCTAAAMDLAAANGHDAVVEFLHKNRFESCTRAASYLATRNGHVAVLAYLLLHVPEKCAFLDGSAPEMQQEAADKKPSSQPWQTHFLMHCAVEHGHLAIVQLLHNAGYPHNLAETKIMAEHYDRKDIAAWLALQKPQPRTRSLRRKRL